METRSENTKELYIKRTKQLMIRAYKESFELDKEIDKKTIIINYNNKERIALKIINTVIWCVKVISKSVTQKTWKLYRSALIYYSEEELKNGGINEIQYKKIKELLKKTKSEITKSEGKTSSKKKKSFNAKEMKMIDSELKKSRSKWANPTRIFIRAGKYTGLRPIEWNNVKLIKDKKIIIVQNAKNTNGRSFGKERTLSLKHLNNEQLNDIDLHIKLSSKMIENQVWDLYYNGCSSLLKRVSRKIWKNKNKYPTLYSCRHQFAADMKASGCTKREVAALMGHASERTAESHYGKKIHGTRGKKPSISKVDISLVKKSNKNKFKFD